MIDAHTHLENGDLSIEYVHKFIDAAKEKGITHLQILDHTHRFFEFKDCYKRVCEVSTLQEEWFLKKQKNSIDDYLKLIEAIKKVDPNVFISVKQSERIIGNYYQKPLD